MHDERPTPTPRQVRTGCASSVESCTFAHSRDPDSGSGSSVVPRSGMHALAARRSHLTHSIAFPTSLLFLPHFTRPAPLRVILTTTFPSPDKHIIILIRNTAPSSLGIYVFICSWIPYSYKYLLLPSCFAILLSVSGLYALFSVTFFLASRCSCSIYNLQYFPYRSPSSCCIYCKPVCVYVYMYVRAALN